MSETDFDLDDFDYLQLRVFNERFSKNEIYLFISQSRIRHFYRIERDYKTKLDEVIIHKEFYETDEEVHERAKSLAEKVNDNTAVIIAEDADEVAFPGEIEAKVKLAMLMYSWESERQVNENK